jgi:hypothetical protein
MPPAAPPYEGIIPPPAIIPPPHGLVIHFFDPAKKINEEIIHS